MTDIKDRIAMFFKDHASDIMLGSSARYALSLIAACRTRIEDTEAENRKLREALAKLREVVAQEDMAHSSELYIVRIIEAALADKGETK